MDYENTTLSIRFLAIYNVYFYQMLMVMKLLASPTVTLCCLPTNLWFIDRLKLLNAYFSTPTLV